SLGMRFGSTGRFSTGLRRAGGGLRMLVQIGTCFPIWRGWRPSAAFARVGAMAVSRRLPVPAVLVRRPLASEVLVPWRNNERVRAFGAVLATVEAPRGLLERDRRRPAPPGERSLAHR